MPFNPFKKPLGSRLAHEDLQGLVGLVAEGYFSEFKATFPKAAKIAHSIASLANTYGGWYIVGIRTDANHIASEICGFPTDEYPDPVAKVRDSVKNRVDPVPVMYLFPITLSATHSAVAVFVPPDQNTPFVTDDGRVYRRNHDSSDPVPEDRRHTLDYLHERGRDVKRRFKEFCKAEKEPRHVGDDDLAWFNCFLQPSPLGLTDKPQLLNPEGVDGLLRLSQEAHRVMGGEDWSITGNLPFHHAQRTHTSVRLRQGREFLTRPSIQAELFIGGSARFHVPVYLQSLLSFLDSEAPVTRAKDQLESILTGQDSLRGDASRLRCFDVSALLVRVLLLLGFYREWVGQVEQVPDFQVAFSLNGFSFGVPFVDTEEWAASVDRWGLPVLTSSTRVPDDWSHPLVLSTENSIEFIPFHIVHEVASAVGFAGDLMGASLMHAMSRAATIRQP